MVGEDEVERPRPPSLARAIRDSFARFLDEIVLFTLANLAWAALLAAFAAVRVGVPILIVLAPILALPTAVLMRLAVATARDSTPTWRMAREELGRLAGRKLMVAAVQLLLLALAATNVALGAAIGGLGGVASAIVSGWAALAVAVYAIALWPVVCDPIHEAPLREQLRLAVAVVVLRPLQLLLLALVTALAAVVSVQLLVPILFLPSLVLIVIAGYVVPVVDELRPL